jgi:hypothetical protein
MQNFELNYEVFELPFVTFMEENNPGIDEIDFDEIVDHDEIRELMERVLPKEAVLLGSIEMDVANWTTWEIKDYYYIIPLENEDFDWAVFRITWDDNWGRWDWCFDGRIKGFKDSMYEAAKVFLTDAWEKWDIDLEDEDYSPYKSLIEDIEKSIKK